MTRKADSRLHELVRPVAGTVRIGVVLGGLGALTTLLPFIGIAEIGKVLIAAGPMDRSGLILVTTAVVAGLVIGWSCTAGALWLTHVADNRLQARLRRALVRKLGKLPLGWYSDKATGAVRKAVQSDLEDMHHLVAHHYVELVSAVVLPVGGLVYLCWLDWRLMLLAVSTLPVYLVAYAWMMRGFGDKMAALDSTFAKVNGAIVEFVHGIAVVKAFGQTGKAHRGYQQAVSEFSERYSGWVRPLLRLEALTSMSLAPSVIMLVSLAGGSWLLRQGWVSPLDVFAETLVALIIPQSLLTLSQGLTSQSKARAAAQRVAAILDTPELPRARIPLMPRSTNLRFDDVSFCYSNGNPVLSSINLHCAPGTVTALVGASGSGKSTLAKLVPRFHDVTTGALSIGGVDVRNIAPENLYHLVGFVLQDVQLVHGTIADNLRLGRPQASDAEMYRATRAARIHDRILDLPRGYDSVIGEDAVLSGGEAQQVSIARTLLADTPILILDEATAHADPESEAKIQDALSVAAHGRTVLVIAHRLTTITGADQIVVLEGGRAVESGTHTQLIAAKGVYARMWRSSAANDQPLKHSGMEACQ